MVKLEIPREKIGRYDYFSGGQPCCVLGHVLHHFNVWTDDITKVDRLPKELQFLQKVEDEGLRRRTTVAWADITQSNDHGDIDWAVTVLRQNGIDITLT